MIKTFTPALRIAGPAMFFLAGLAKLTATMGAAGLAVALALITVIGGGCAAARRLGMTDMQAIGGMIALIVTAAMASLWVIAGPAGIALGMGSAAIVGGGTVVTTYLDRANAPRKAYVVMMAVMAIMLVSGISMFAAFN